MRLEAEHDVARTSSARALSAALDAVVGAQPQAMQGRNGEALVFFPENPTLGPGRDA